MPIKISEETRRRKAKTNIKHPLYLANRPLKVQEDLWTEQRFAIFIAPVNPFKTWKSLRLRMKERIPYVWAWLLSIAGVPMPHERKMQS